MNKTHFNLSLSLLYTGGGDITLYLFFPNGSSANHTELQVTATQAEVAVFPGMRYRAFLRVENRDGAEQSELHFNTHNAGMCWIGEGGRQMGRNNT